MTGEIAPVGSHFAITLNAVNCATGEPIAREQTEAPSKERVLAAVGDAASAMRRRLGESLRSVQATNTPIVEATTASLDALKAFSSGDVTWLRGNPANAVPFYKRAIELDPNFAVAYGRLATIYRNIQASDTAEPYLRTAFELRERVTERDRWYVTAAYNLYIEYDQQKARETYQMWRDMYPRDATPRNNLGVLYDRLGQSEEAAAAFRDAIPLAPDRELLYSNLASALRHLGRLDDARKVLDDLKARFGETSSYHTLMYEFAYISGNTEEMQQHAAALPPTPT